ncbi:MAG: T9SS type A sorting domain-containing protein [Chryseobacterium sp.]|jgi:hypothetical protein|uniref:T9SS type A sorting domain-containing protein n=1 Tax=Chryseobacterium sp. TaxID=1871047 RepID=UPI00282CE1D8|nr:T9SS type A sorting domain-containing protein [Chryseobacterium sp.]MDR2235015.1 T9SS type A sorting domain-containing protein [Chryseobacterium sp.]
MRRKLLTALSVGVMAFSYNALSAQDYQTLPIQSGFTADVIANGVGAANTTTTLDVDGVNYAFVARNFQLSATSNPINFGIPVNGVINSVVAATPGLSYQLASLDANNSLRLATTNDSGTLSLATPSAALKLYLLVTSGSGTSTVSATVNFSDGSSQAFTGIALADWYGGSGYAIQGIGRVSLTDNVTDAAGGTNPRLYQKELILDAGNQSKTIQSITITKTGGTGIANIFAVSANFVPACQSPTNITAVPTAGSAQINWTEPATPPSNGYEFYYSTSSTPPTDLTDPTGSLGAGVTTVDIPGLNAVTTYYFWLRSNCGSVKGIWKPFTFSTLCGAINLPWAENFDSMTSVGPVPTCWLNVTGTKAWTTTNSTSYNTPKSAPNYARIAYGNTTASQLWTPGFNLTAGVPYTFAFNYNTGGTGSSYIGYTGNVRVNTEQALTGASDLGTFITPDQGTTSYTPYSAVFTPPTTGVYYFAIDVSSTGAPWYLGIDDLSLVSGNLATSEVKAKENPVKISPNPFADMVTISHVEKVKRLSVSDASGRLVKTIDKPSAQVNLSDLSAGVYFLNVEMTDGTQQTIKGIKK